MESPPARSGPLEILHLEDSPYDAELVLETLLQGGLAVRVTRVETREDFSAALRERCFDLVLADYSLPSFDGLAALQIARELCPGVPFIFLSGALGEEQAIECMKSGATDYVLKQKLTRLVPAVDRALREAKEHVERERLTRELEKERGVLQAVVEGTPEAIAVFDGKDFRLKWWNQAFRSVHEASGVRDLIGLRVQDLVPSADSIGLIEIFRRVVANGETYSSAEYELKGFREETTYWRWSLQRLPGTGAGSAPDLLLVALEVTGAVAARRRVEELAAASAASLVELRAVVSAMAEGLIVVEPGGTVRNVNPAALVIFDLPSVDAFRTARMEGAFRFLDLRGERLGDREDPIDRALAGEVYSDVRLRLVRRPGDEPRVVSISGTPVWAHPGDMALAVVTLRDITAIQHAQEDLRVSEERFRISIKSSPVTVFNQDRDLRYTWIHNPIPPYTVQKVLGKTDDDLFSPANARALAGIKRLVLEGGEGVREEIDLAPPDPPLSLDMTVEPLRGPNGEVIGITGAAMDITLRKRTEAELEEARVSAEAASRAKDRFLAVLSHELRNPLTPVLAAVSTLGRDPDLPDHVREDFGMIRRNVELEARLIDDLLDLTRISQGKLQLQARRISPDEVLVHAIEICRAAIRAKEMTLEIRLEAGSAFVFADPIRLQQVFWNLIKNAVKFTPAGGRIEVRSENRNGKVAIEVSDTGVGIEPASLPRIFDAFEQEERSNRREFGGLGLGLTISRALVEMQGGTLRAESEGKGRGARFTVEFPAVEAPPPSARGTAAPEERPGKGLKILLVEDHEDTARIISRLLQRVHHVVRTAGSVRSALTAAAEEPFDLVISDIGLPDGDGFELMAELKSHYHLKGIALSGYGMDADISNSRKAGFSEHLTKPVDFQKLQSVIEQVAE